MPSLLSFIKLFDPSGVSQTRMVIAWMCENLNWFMKIMAALITPGIMAWVSPLFWLVFVIPIYYSNNNMVKDDKGEKSFGKAVGVAFGIFWAIFSVIFMISIAIGCKVNSYMV